LRELLLQLLDRRRQTVGNFAVQAASELAAPLRLERGHALFPGEPRRAIALARGAPLRADVSGNFERRRGPAEPLSRCGDFFGAERGAVTLFGAAFVRRAKANRGLAGDQRWPIGFSGHFDGARNRCGILAVDPQRHPAGRFETLHLIDGI
jgi:hypothetical protein